MKILKLLIITTIFISMVIAQGQPPKRPPIKPVPTWERNMHGMGKAERLRTIKIWKLTEYLDLTEDQSTRFFPRFNNLEDIIRDKYKEKMYLVKKIEEEIDKKDGSITSREVNSYIDKLYGIDKDIINEKEKFIRGLSDILTPEQQLKYLIFEDKFRMQMMKVFIKEEKEIKREEDKK
ncbi:MAG: hypothetical protein H0Z29_04935 [Candidatus Marinimicrobia bacterium]|nr:hypothetical protein [Candidatus Neomarinimicrobiota bacterium]